ncbi:MAG: N-acetylmuramoyl-L-alanine amidase [Smithellaceae bacterium]|nr:N-acetylmuramoyl-L-alanine amidase [Smithellaceae bacterium]
MEQHMTMRRIGIVSLFCVAVLTCFLWAAETKAEATKVVVIDAGHGGGDHGVAIGDKLYEKDITLKVARLIEKDMAHVPGVQVKLTRSTDREMSSAQRVSAIKALRPDALISIHVNAGFGKDASGFEFYFPGFAKSTKADDGSQEIIRDMGRTRSLNESVRLAQVLEKYLGNVFPRKGRGLREAPMALLEGIDVPAVVVEMGFATNPEERKLLADEKTEEMLAREMAAAIKAYLQ